MLVAMNEGFDAQSITHFRYTSYSIDYAKGNVELGYELAGDGPKFGFTERVELGPSTTAAVPEQAFDAVVRLLWLAAGLSYYKAAAPPTVEIAGGLTAAEQRFLATLIRHGLGEFAYVNDLEAALEPTIVTPVIQAPADPLGWSVDASRSLVAVGGGKDSIVTADALVGAGLDVTLFAVNCYQASGNVVDAMGLPFHLARRTIDPGLIRINALGALNGHIPVTAINSIIGVLVAMRSGFSDVVFSNERSASVENVEWKGHLVNHQWSKSVAFERLLRDMLEFNGVRINYVSLLRPLSEMRIMSRFAKLTEYHRVFLSCNRAFRLDESQRTAGWCCDCPKCRFVYLAMSAWLPPAELTAIFGHDMFADPTQERGFRELLGLVGHKPLECVGEIEECRVALQLAAQSPPWSDHPFVARLGAEVGPLIPAHSMDVVFSFGDDHCLAKDLEELAREIV